MSASATQAGRNKREDENTCM